MSRFNQLFLFLILGLIACTSMQTSPSDTDKILVVDKVDTYKCKFIAIVSGTYTTPWDAAEKMVDGAIREAKLDALEKKADQVMLQGSPQIIYNSESKQREATVTMNAYQCKK